MTWGKFFWAYWIIVTAVTFLGPELYALFTNVQNTLSDYARYQLNVTTAISNQGIHTLAWWASFIAWVVFVAWITPHIWWAKFG